MKLAQYRIVEATSANAKTTLSTRLLNEFTTLLDSKTTKQIHPIHLATLSKLFPLISEKYSSILHFESQHLFDSCQEQAFRDLSERWTAVFIFRVSQAHASFLSLRKSYFRTKRDPTLRTRWNALFSTQHL